MEPTATSAAQVEKAARLDCRATRAFRQNRFSCSWNRLITESPRAMRWINQRAGEYFDEATFAGAIGFELDFETQQLRWSCAGLPEKSGTKSKKTKISQSILTR